MTHTLHSCILNITRCAEAKGVVAHVGCEGGVEAVLVWRKRWRPSERISLKNIDWSNDVIIRGGDIMRTTDLDRKRWGKNTAEAY